ncbi:hypothetical protein [Nonomuraea roseola]|uniref:Uncharacterized protein n=1 Tax=Nonomuraea roseola TaxID=46179 RepID=A0ABV5QAC0_9ACTN
MWTRSRLFGTAPGWWSAAAVAYLILGLVAIVGLRARMPSSAAVARRAVSSDDRHRRGLAGAAVRAASWISSGSGSAARPAPWFR